MLKLKKLLFIEVYKFKTDIKKTKTAERNQDIWHNQWKMPNP